MVSNTGTTRQPSPEAAEDRLLLERIRLAAMLVMAGIAAVFVGELVLRPGERPGISIIQAVNFAALAASVRFARDPSRRTFNCLLCFFGFAVTAVSIGAVGIVASDPTSPLVVLVGLALGASILVPWGVRYQLPSVVLTTAVAIWTLASIGPGSPSFWIQPVGSVLPTFAASVIIAYVLRRQRLAVADAERERAARESGLREANRRLEMEIRDHEKTEEALRFALRELDHRVKNTLATLQSVAQQTLETSRSAEEFAEGFRGRIRAMARIHTALAARRWEGLALGELIELVVGPYRLQADSVSIDCERASFSSADARALGMALHELATNAAKYGALSTNEGRVRISSRIDAGSERRLRLTWSEQDGPPVAEPARRGLGSKLIEDALAYESGGTARLTFEPGGVRCEIEMPLPPGED